MIPWWAGVLLFVAGDLMGIVVMAICEGSSDKHEEKTKKNRQRGNTDGSMERSSRE